jgi:hypothetical protein
MAKIGRLYNGQLLTELPIRKDGYYWVRLPGIDPLIAKYTTAVHAGTGKWYGIWRVTGHSPEWNDSDFCYIAPDPLEFPGEIL